MSNVAKLKKQAAELELKKQFDKALAIYIKLLDTFDENAGELDVALFNRVGDLMLRQGNVADAVDYYEKAVDRYADTGFFNNAIALCNKILRHSPGRASIYYKLGKISAQKGFKNDAKVNFLEYADRMKKAGKVDESFRALKEFADLCPDQDEIRLMLADQLTKADRKPEAIEQLQTLYERYAADGRVTEASATAERMRAIDPSAEPRSAAGTSRKNTTGELIFLDLDTPSPRTSGAGSRWPTPPVPATPPAAPAISRPNPPATSTVPPIEARPIEARPSEARPMTPPDVAAPVAMSPPPPRLDTPLDTPLDGVTRIGDDTLGLERTPSDSLAGLESTSLAERDSGVTTPSSSLLDLEPTSLSGEITTPVNRSPAPTHAARARGALTSGEPEFTVPEPEPTPAKDQPSIEFDLSMLTSSPTSAPAQRQTPKTTRAALEGLPLMDLDLPARTPPPSRASATPRGALPTVDDLELVEDSSDLSDASMQTDDGALIDLNAQILTPDDGELVIIPTPPAPRTSTMVAARSVEILKASVEGEPQNWGLRRELAEAMLDAGHRGDGMKELELAMTGAERSGELDLASSLAEEIARLEPESVKHHQKRVEYAFRTNDRPRLVEAYVSLADALLRSDQADKARMLYQHLLDLAPDDPRVKAALDAIGEPELEVAAPASPASRATGSGHRRPTAAAPVPEPVRAVPPTSASFVNLGDWLRADAGPKDTRMVVDEQEPSGDEEADFADMLRKFKQGVAENVDAEDYQSHYDLAIAFKEMGLLDEAIAEFQKALGSPTNRLPTYEALGQCFLEKGQFRLASSILSRGLNEKAEEEQLLGILYLLGRAAEAQGNAADAIGYYQRVFVLDIQFRDTADRLNELERAPR